MNDYLLDMMLEKKKDSMKGLWMVSLSDILMVLMSDVLKERMLEQSMDL